MTGGGAMTRVTILVALAAAALAAGCLDTVIPLHAASSTPTGSEVAGLPVYDMAHTYAADPTTDGGAPVRFKDLQAQFDKMGCTASTCHGGTQVPVLMGKPASNQALLNYYDLLSGCANGSPDPSDCVSPGSPAASLILLKNLATSGLTHTGGKPFASENDPTYALWLAWIAAGCPY